MAAAILETKIQLQAQQFKQESAQVVQTAKQMQQGMGKVQAQSLKMGREIDKSMKSVNAKIDLSQWKQFEVQLKKIGNTSAEIGKLKPPIVALGNVISGSLKMGFVGATAAATGFFALMASNASRAKTILQDSMRLNIDTTTLQQWTIAGGKFGLSADKIADVMKDVNDKIGDFVMTGGGEVKDLFEQLHLEAKDFIGLSPDKVLEKMAAAANKLTTQDKTFLFESLADDASLLLPILEQNSAKLNEIKKQTLEKGMILSHTELKALEKFNAGLSEMGDKIVAFGQHVAAYMAEPLQVVLDYVKDVIDGFGGMDNAAMEFAKVLVSAMRDGVMMAADLVIWFKELQISAMKFEAYVLSLGKGLARVGQLSLKYTPMGQAADLAYKATTGKFLSTELKAAQADFANSLDDLSEKQAQTSAEIENIRKKYKENAEKIGNEMLKAIEKSEKNMNAAQKNGYAAPLVKDNRQASLDKWQKKQDEEAAKKAAEEAEKLKKKMEAELKTAEKQSNAAEKLEKAAQKLADWEIQAKLYQGEANIRANTVESKINGLSPREYVKSELERVDAILKQREASENLKNSMKQLDVGLISVREATDKTFQAMVNAVNEANARMQAQTEQVAAPENRLSPPPSQSQNINITLSGDVNVKLDGANDTVARAVVGSETFKLGVAELVKPELLKIIQGAAVSVGRPVI